MGSQEVACDFAPPVLDATWPSCSTIGVILAENQLIKSPSRYTGLPKSSRPLTVARKPNDVWSIDFKGWFRTVDRVKCHPLTVMDSYTRFLISCKACTTVSVAQVRPAMEEAFRTYGLPKVIRSDNGHPFSSKAAAGLSSLNVWWLKLGIRPEQIAPHKPQQNGYHERMHRTLKAELSIALNIAEQQAAIDTFLQTYNHHRPHEALGMAIPGELYTCSEQPYPDSVPEVSYPSSMYIRRVRSNGGITWNSQECFISESLIGEPVGLLPYDDRFIVLFYMEIPLMVWDDIRGRWLRRRQASAIASSLLNGNPDVEPPKGPEISP